jgi:hypothetical protein
MIAAFAELVANVAISDSLGNRFPVGGRWPLGGKNVSTVVAQTGRPPGSTAMPMPPGRSRTGAASGACNRSAKRRVRRG